MTAKKPAPAKTPTAATAKAAKAPADELKKTAKPAAKAGGAVAVVEAKGKGPAKKGKVDDKAKKPDGGDVDLSDLEADLEGEPEVDAVSEEAKAKAKPLRMKVSRAKERALMREFGLDETALTEEEVAKRRQELKTLIKMGKPPGFLWNQETKDHLRENCAGHDTHERTCSLQTDMAMPV